MTVVLLLLIALGWTAWLTPRWLRHRRAAHPGGSIDAFHQQLSKLSALDRPITPAAGAEMRPLLSPRSIPTRASVPPVPLARAGRRPALSSRREMRQRRREVLFALLAAAALTLVPALVLGPVALYAHLLVDVALVAYVVLLVRAQKLASERQLKVRYMPQPRPQPSPLLLRRSASS